MNEPAQMFFAQRGGSDICIAELAAGMASGRLTSRQIVQTYLSRIHELDEKGPALRAVLEINPDALEVADAMDRERAKSGPRGPLHGVPILIKDNIDTADRMTTTAGSLALQGSIAPRDAFIVGRLRSAGAVLLGKANLSEWANFRSSRSSSGWSARGGQTRNPYVLNRSPSGSSSGSAAAAAANLCAAAVGTETDGSIVSPASACGCVGIKPTVGLLSRSGIIPISRSQDTAGPIARTVEDAAILLAAMIGIDPRDDSTRASEGHEKFDYQASLQKDGLRGARIGIIASAAEGSHPSALRVLSDAVAAFKSQGATVVDAVEVPGMKRLEGAPMQVLLHEFKAGIDEYLGGLPAGIAVRSLKDLIEFNEKHADREMPFFGQELFIAAQKKGGLDSPEYLAALATCRDATRRDGIDGAMDKAHLDALVSITAGPAGPIDLIYGDIDTHGSSTLAAVAGYPSITVPAGYCHGLPIGISFTGRAFSESKLIRLAYAFEQTTKVRRPPRCLPDVAPGPGDR